MPLQNEHFEEELGYLPQEGEELILTWWKLLEKHQSGRILVHVQYALGELTKWRLPLEPLLAFVVSYLVRDHKRLSREKFSSLNKRVLELAHELAEFDQEPVKHTEDERIKRADHFNRLRRLFYKAYTNLELVLLVLASHITRMENIELLDYSQARLLCEDNEVIYLPLMELLGLWDLRRKYGDKSLERLNPKKIFEMINIAKEATNLKLNQNWDEIQAVLSSRIVITKIEATVRQHIGSNSSIYRRLLQGETLKNVMNQLKVDVIVDTEEDCYRLLYVIHKNWPPLLGRTPSGGYFRDLIASPKFNGYRALVTTVEYRRDREQDSRLPVEFRIYTRDMEKTNRTGVIAFQYQQNPPIRAQNVWWEDRDLLDFINSHPPEDNTIGDIYVFSPVGKVYRSLEFGSTPIDYAYRIHTNIGNHCKRIWVNGEPGYYNQKLHNGDLVEIEVDPEYPGPDPIWLSTVKTPTARDQIRHALRKPLPPKGRYIINKVLNSELKYYDMIGKISDKEVDEFIEKTAHKFAYSDVNGLYIDIATPNKSNDSPRRRINNAEGMVYRLIAQKLATQIARIDGIPLGVSLDHISFARRKQNDQEVRVVAGCEIVGHLKRPGSKFARLVVFRKDDPNAPVGEKAIPLEWIGDRRPGEPVEIKIEAVDRPRLLGTVLEKIYKLYDNYHVYLVAANSSINLEREAELRLTIETPDLKSLELLYEELNGLKAAAIIDDFRLETLNPIEKMRLREPKRIHNPYTMGPVYERRVFKGRDLEIDLIISSLRGDQNVVVLYGPNRVGKTSLIRYFQLHVAEEYNFLPVMLDLQGIPEHTEDRFWTDMINKIKLAFEQQYHGIKTNLRIPVRRSEGNTFEDFRERLAETIKVLPSRKLLIMIDELNLLDEVWKDPQDALRVIYHLKSIVETYRQVGFLFCVQEGLFRQLHISRTQSIKWNLLRSGTPIRLDYLDKAAATKLIRDPVDQIFFDDDVVDQIIHLTACHPFYLHHLLHRIVNHASFDHKNISREDLQEIIPEITSNGEHIFQNLWQECCGGNREQIMKTLAFLSGVDCRPVTTREIYEQIRKSENIVVKQPSISTNLERLSDVGILKKLSGRVENSYIIRVPLFTHWLLRDQPITG